MECQIRREGLVRNLDKKCGKTKGKRLCPPKGKYDKVARRIRIWELAKTLSLAPRQRVSQLQAPRQTHRNLCVKGQQRNSPAEERHFTESAKNLTPGRSPVASIYIPREASPNLPTLFSSALTASLKFIATSPSKRSFLHRGGHRPPSRFSSGVLAGVPSTRFTVTLAFTFLPFLLTCGGTLSLPLIDSRG